MNEAEVPATVDKSTLEFIDGKVSEFGFAVEKGETSGKYGKPAAYWKQFRDAIANKTAVSIKKKTKNGEMDAWEIGGKLYAVPNHDPSDQVNTIDKMAQKRALVAMVLITTNASDYFTQDMEDFVPDTTHEPVSHETIEGEFTEAPGREIDQDKKYKRLSAEVVKMVATTKGLSTSDAAKAIEEMFKAGKIPAEGIMETFENAIK